MISSKTKSLAIISLIITIQMGCGRNNPASTEISDNDAINLLISSSSYADYSNYTDDGMSEFTITGVKNDSFPSEIFFRRRIESRDHSINISYDSSGTFATARITTGFTGRLVVDNNQNGVCDTMVRALSDVGQRYVWFKKWGDRWKVYGASLMVVKTADPANEIIIDSVSINGDLGARTGVIFRNRDFGQTMKREDMPIFYPGARVTVTVWAGPAAASDSCWVFMHRRVLQNGTIIHQRTPMINRNNYEFSYSWEVDPITQPVVRHAAIDVILGSSLFGDNSAEYSACIWTAPYIVTDNDSLPKQ